MRGRRGPVVPSFQPASISVHSNVANWSRASFRCACVILAPGAVAFDRSEFLSASPGGGAETLMCFGRDLWLVDASYPSFSDAPVTSTDTGSFLESRVCSSMMRPFVQSIFFVVLYQLPGISQPCQLGLMFRRRYSGPSRVLRTDSEQRLNCCMWPVESAERFVVRSKGK